MKVNMWAAAKDAMSFSWQIKEAVLGFSIFYALMMVALVWLLYTAGLNYVDPMAYAEASAMGVKIEVSWDAQLINIITQILALLGAIAGGYYFQTTYIRKADNPAEKLTGSFQAYAVKGLIVKLVPGALMAGLSVLGLPGMVMLGLGIGFVVAQILVMRFELSVTSTAIGGQDQDFAAGYKLGAGQAFKMFAFLIVAAIIVFIVYIPIEFVFGLSLTSVITEVSFLSTAAVVFMQSLKAGSIIAVSAMVLGAYYCALRPEYGFMDDDMFYAVGFEEDDIADTEKVDELSDAEATAKSSGYGKKS